MLQQRMNISTLLPLQGKAIDLSLATKGTQESFGGFCYVHTNDSMSIAARDWYTPNFPLDPVASLCEERTSLDRVSDRTA